eukprot:12017394-Karenia_brevis.AAC.1
MSIIPEGQQASGMPPRMIISDWPSSAPEFRAPCWQHIFGGGHPLRPVPGICILRCRGPIAVLTSAS